LIAVTGATGGVGGRVARLLAERGVPMRLAVRDASRAPSHPGVEVIGGASYADGEAMRRAFEGADTVLLVSAGDDEHRIDLHRTAVDAAAAAGARRVVYTSYLYARPDTVFTFGRNHFDTEEHIKASGLEWTFLRDSMYLDVVPYFVGEDGLIRGPAGDGRVSAVTRDDIAACATVVLTEDGHAGAAYEMTGPEAFSMAEVADRVGRVVRRDLGYVDETMEEARASRAPTGAPAWQIEGWVTSYAAVAAGEWERVSDDVERLTGRKPRTLEDFMRENPQSYAHLQAG
jgi:NAD(P)H dehydrogenase (quinone)